MNWDELPKLPSDRRVSRRQFIGRSAMFAGAAALLPGVVVRAADAVKRTAADQVALGKSGVTISRLGLGTGSAGGKTQLALGQEGFTKLVHHAFDRGVTFIDTAESYHTHEFVAQAIKGLPREKLFIQTKMRWNEIGYFENLRREIDRLRKELNTDYLDSLLIHCATASTWPDDLKAMMDAFAEAQQKKIIRLKGVSCHGLPALLTATGVDWVDVHLVRVNPQGHYVDGRTGEKGEPGRMPLVLKEIESMHAKGRGIIGMKLIGNGDFRNPDDREKAMRYAMSCKYVDAVTIGFGSIAELDESIERMNRVLAEV